MITFVDLIGWIGASALAICAFPQAYMSFKQKHSNGISWGFLSLWGGGEFFQFIYVVAKNEYPIIFNCVLNLALLGIIIYYKFKGK